MFSVEAISEMVKPFNIGIISKQADIYNIGISHSVISKGEKVGINSGGGELMSFYKTFSINAVISININNPTMFYIGDYDVHDVRIDLRKYDIKLNLLNTTYNCNFQFYTKQWFNIDDLKACVTSLLNMSKVIEAHLNNNYTRLAMIDKVINTLDKSSYFEIKNMNLEVR